MVPYLATYVRDARRYKTDARDANLPREHYYESTRPLQEGGRDRVSQASRLWVHVSLSAEAHHGGLRLLGKRVLVYRSIGNSRGSVNNHWLLFLLFWFQENSFSSQRTLRRRRRREDESLVRGRNESRLRRWARLSCCRRNVRLCRRRDLMRRASSRYT